MTGGVPLRRVAMFLLAGILLSSVLGATLFYWTSATVSQFPIGSGSWNPVVPCSSPSIVRITDITANMTGSASQTSSLFNPGGPSKRWLTPGATPSGWVSPGPPCNITNSRGTVAVFVEIDGVSQGGITNEDCSGSYDSVNGGTSNGGSYCDSTFNIYDPAVVPDLSASCGNSSDPTCHGIIHSEIDRDWKAARYCGPSTACDDAALGSQTTSSTLIDVQGFVYWDPNHLGDQWHSFNGWEIHPLTAWRLHQSNPSLTASFSFSPSSPATGQTITFTASPSGGTPPYTFNWSFGDGTTATGNPASHSYPTSGTFTVQLTVHDSAGAAASTTQTVTVNQPTPPDFSISSSPSSIQVSPGASGFSTIRLTSLGSFAGTINLSPSISPSGPIVSMNPAAATLSSGGGATSTLTVSTQSSTPPGDYTVTITANGGSISHSTTVLVAVRPAPDFSITANPRSISITQSSSGTSNITLTSINGFSGTVSLFVSVSSSGLKTALSPTSVTLASGGSNSAVLTLRALKKTPIGSYTVTVTATSGSLSHSTTITISVT